MCPVQLDYFPGRSFIARHRVAVLKDQDKEFLEMFSGNLLLPQRSFFSTWM